MNDYVNRRDFIKTFSLIASASFVAGNISWLKDLQAQSSGKVVRLGIIGFGSRGATLHLFLKDIPDLDICCFCDTYEPHFNYAQNILGSKTRGYRNYQDLLEKEKPDAVVIATPLHEHFRPTVAALKNGIHVFCEKSMARTIEDCNEMVKTWKENGKILQIGHQRMFNIKYHQAYKLIREGKIGPVTQIRAFWHRNNDWRKQATPDLERFINWRLYHEYSCGLMTELASHHIQVANEILDEAPECVWGAGSINHWKDGREAWDNVNLVYKYPRGTQLVYDSLISNKHFGLEIQVQGSKGTMELEKGKMWDEFPPPAPGILQLINHLEHKLFEEIPIGGASWVPDSAISAKGNYILDEVMEDDGTRMQMEAFIANVRENRVDEVVTKQGFYSSIATIMGFNAIMNNEIVYWPKDLAM